MWQLEDGVHQVLAVGSQRLVEALFHALAISEDEVGSLLDASVVRAHQDSCSGRGGPKKNAPGRSRGGFSPKTHAVVGTYGRALHLEVSEGQAHYSTYSSRPLDYIIGKARIADTAYDSDRFRAEIAGRGIKAVIPSLPSRLRNFHLNRRLYRKRIKVEHFLHHLKRIRLAATGYEKTSRNFLAVLYTACI
ncbi:MAG: IS5 family transposase [Oxalobacteraceae bacterium]|nr:MAG: IS5 family transposase [Oxalobacteraceae bacterium]